MSNFLSWSALILLFSLLSRFYLVVSSNSKKTLIGANNEARYDQVYWVEQSGMSHKHAERETTFFISALTSSSSRAILTFSPFFGFSYRWP